MAGWSDIVGAGAISRGYVLDIKFFNTYINALKEKEQFLNISVAPDEIDDSEPFIIRKGNIVSIINAYKSFMNNIEWIRIDRFNNPESFGSIDRDTDEIWTADQIKTLITEDVYNIINNPSSTSYGINDLLAANVWNGMYKLYKDVFNIVEQREIKSTLITWEEFGFVGSSKGESSEDSADITTFLDDGEAEYDGETVAVIDSGSGTEKFHTSLFQRSHKQENPTENPRVFETSDFEGGRQYNIQPQYTVRKHTIKNFDDDYVKLEVSAQGYLSQNSEYDSWGASSIIVPRDEETESAWITGFNQVSTGGTPEVIAYPFDNSVLTASGWELTGFKPDIPAYNCNEGNMIYDYNDMYDGTDGLDRRIDKINNFEITAGQNGTSDMYYKTNVSGMIYNPS